MRSRLTVGLFDVSPQCSSNKEPIPLADDGLAGTMRESRLRPADQCLIDFLDFADVAQAFTEGYAKLIHNGSPASEIAMAMLGATLNIYEMFGLRAELPGLFRSLADRIETDGRAN